LPSRRSSTNRFAAATVVKKAGSVALRVFSDSAPVLEGELAARSGLGWRGNNAAKSRLMDRGKEDRFVSVSLPSEPDGRISRIRLSG